MSTSAFALAVAEEFIILSALTLLAVELELYPFWAGMMLGFFIHLLVHVGQFAIYRGYVPVILTSLPSGLYCLIALHDLNVYQPLDWKLVAIWTLVSLVIIGANLALALNMAAKFETWLGKNFPERKLNMEMKNIPFGITNWAEIVPTEHKGETGMALWRTQQFDYYPRAHGGIQRGLPRRSLVRKRSYFVVPGRRTAHRTSRRQEVCPHPGSKLSGRRPCRSRIAPIQKSAQNFSSLIENSGGDSCIIPAAMNTKPFDLVIFDCDGVLVDSEPLANRVFVQIVREYGYELDERNIPEGIFWRTYTKDRIHTIERELNWIAPGNFLDIFNKRFTAIDRKRTSTCHSGIHSLIESLSVPICVASNGSREEIALRLKIAKLTDHFGDAIFSGLEVPHPKPAPDVYLAAAKAFNVSPIGVS